MVRRSSRIGPYSQGTYRPRAVDFGELLVFAAERTSWSVNTLQEQMITSRVLGPLGFVAFAHSEGRRAICPAV